MEKAVHCDCGFVARAEDESGLVDAIRHHAWDVHRMALSPDEALLVGFRAELDAEPPSREEEQ